MWTQPGLVKGVSARRRLEMTILTRNSSKHSRIQWRSSGNCWRCLCPHDGIARLGSSLWAHTAGLGLDSPVYTPCVKTCVINYFIPFLLIPCSDREDKSRFLVEILSWVMTAGSGKSPLCVCFPSVLMNFQLMSKEKSETCKMRKTNFFHSS